MPRPSKEELDTAGWNDDFDWLRANYRNLTFNDLKRLSEIWLKRYPVQRYYDREFVVSCFRRIMSELHKDSLRVVELGGYNGELALEMSEVFPRLDWLNIEIIQHEPLAGLDRYKYREYVLLQQIWDDGVDISGRDVFVSFDTLEHFPNDEFEKIVLYLSMNRPRFLILKIPILDQGQRWSGKSDSHLLTMGSRRVRELLSSSYEILIDDQRRSSADFLLFTLPRKILEQAVCLVPSSARSRLVTGIRSCRWPYLEKMLSIPGWHSFWRLNEEKVTCGKPATM